MGSILTWGEVSIMLWVLVSVQRRNDISMNFMLIGIVRFIITNFFIKIYRVMEFNWNTRISSLQRANEVSC